MYVFGSIVYVVISCVVWVMWTLAPRIKEEEEECVTRGAFGELDGMR